MKRERFNVSDELKDINYIVFLFIRYNVNYIIEACYILYGCVFLLALAFLK
jgi:hypothetical protein